MEFRELNKEEIRAAALELMLIRDWMTIRDFLLKFFPYADRFSYRYASEYNDEGYDIRLDLEDVKNDTGVFLVHDGQLTAMGIEKIRGSQAFRTEEQRVKSQTRSYVPNPESFFYDGIAQIGQDWDHVLWLPDGENSDLVEVVLPEGPSRKFPKLYVPVE